MGREHLDAEQMAVFDRFAALQLSYFGMAVELMNQGPKGE